VTIAVEKSWLHHSAKPSRALPIAAFQLKGSAFRYCPKGKLMQLCVGHDAACMPGDLNAKNVVSDDPRTFNLIRFWMKRKLG
jgi:hypothetical protein